MIGNPGRVRECASSTKLATTKPGYARENDLVVKAATALKLHVVEHGVHENTLEPAVAWPTIEPEVIGVQLPQLEMMLQALAVARPQSEFWLQVPPKVHPFMHVKQAVLQQLLREQPPSVAVDDAVVPTVIAIHPPDQGVVEDVPDVKQERGG